MSRHSRRPCPVSLWDNTEPFAVCQWHQICGYWACRRLGVAGFWDPVVIGKKNFFENGYVCMSECVCVCRYIVLGGGGE